MERLAGLTATGFKAGSPQYVFMTYPHSRTQKAGDKPVLLVGLVAAVDNRGAAGGAAFAVRRFAGGRAHAGPAGRRQG